MDDLRNLVAGGRAGGNATRVLRRQPDAIAKEKIWTRGGDCEIVDGQENRERVVQYIDEAQERMEREL